MSRILFTLKPVPPFRLDLTVWTLRRRPENLIDRWDGECYRRALALGRGAAEVVVKQAARAKRPRLEVAIEGGGTGPHARAAVTAALERMLGIRVDLAEFYRFASHDERLAPLARRFRGMKPPRFPSMFESVANGIACQQLSLALGIHLLGRLARAYGDGLGDTEEQTHAFPQPETLAPLRPEQLRPLGFSRQKARALIDLASALAAKRINLEALASASDEAALNALLQLRGVGRWTAEYVLLRGLSRLHVFPGDDVGARNNLVRWLGLPGPLDYDGVRRVLAPWSEYGGLIYFHLLLQRLADAGWIR